MTEISSNPASNTSLNETLNTVFSAWPVLLFFIVAVSILIYAWCLFRKKTFKQTQGSIDRFAASGKYIEDLFIELGDNKESLRYFLFSWNWKRRLLKSYNSLVSGHFKEIVSSLGYATHLSVLMSHKRITTEIQKTHNWIQERARKEGVNFRVNEVERNLEPLINSYRRYIEYFSEISRHNVLMNTRLCYLVGTAGNGKTNLACSVAHTAILNRHTCILLNSRELHGEVEAAALTQIDLPKYVSKHLQIVLWLHNLYLIISRKQFLIIIDAINENDSTEFADTLYKFLNDMLRYSKTRVILSCRSEYYEQRTNKFFHDKPLCMIGYRFDIENGTRDKLSSDLIFSAYRSHYNFNGTISLPVQNKLLGSLLLLRIFFEAYNGCSLTIASINKYEIYKKYIECVRIQVTIQPYPSVAQTLLPCSTARIADRGE